MRTAAELIEEAKFNSDNTDATNRFNDAAWLRFLNSAIRQIHMVIYNAYPQDPIFSRDRIIPLVPGQNIYNLPKDMLTPNSVHLVVPRGANEKLGRPMRRLSLQESANDFGYNLRGGKLEVIPESLTVNTRFTDLLLIYAKEPSQVSSIADTPSLPTIVEDYLTLFMERKAQYVDSSNDIQNSNIFKKEVKQEIADLFADSARDPKYVPIASEVYMNY